MLGHEFQEEGDLPWLPLSGTGDPAHLIGQGVPARHPEGVHLSPRLQPDLEAGQADRQDQRRGEQLLQAGSGGPDGPVGGGWQGRVAAQDSGQPVRQADEQEGVHAGGPFVDIQPSLGDAQAGGGYQEGDSSSSADGSGGSGPANANQDLSHRDAISMFIFYY